MADLYTDALPPDLYTIFMASDDACEPCLDLRGYRRWPELAYTLPIHYNCLCTEDTKTVPKEQFADQEEETGTRLERVELTRLDEKGSERFKRTWSVKRSWTATTKAGIEGGEMTGGFSFENALGGEDAKTVNYVERIGGTTQIVNLVYEVREFQIFQKWTFYWGGVTDDAEDETYLVMKGEPRLEYRFVKYEHLAIA